MNETELRRIVPTEEINLLRIIINFNTPSFAPTNNAVVVDTLQGLLGRLDADESITYGDLTTYTVGLPQAIRGYMRAMHQHTELDNTTASMCQNLLKPFQR